VSGMAISTIETSGWPAGPTVSQLKPPISGSDTSARDEREPGGVAVVSRR
jgi:hypothetical protein